MHFGTSLHSRDTRRIFDRYFNPVYESAGGPNARGGMRSTHTPANTAFLPGFASSLYDWYKPPMTRRECTDHLMSQGEGAFVVRDSDSNPGLLLHPFVDSFRTAFA